MLKSAQPISQLTLAQCILCWQFDDLKDMYLALQSFSVIRMVVAGKRRVHYIHGVAAGTRGWGAKGACVQYTEGAQALAILLLVAIRRPTLRKPASESLRL